MKVNKGTIIDKDFILDRVQESDIFERYLGIKVAFNIDYVNPLREDRLPGCRFYTSKKTGRLKFNDFSRGKEYDCFSVVQDRHSLSFGQAIGKVAYDFGLTTKTPVLKGDKIEIPFSLEGDESGVPSIAVSVRPFNQREKIYWSQYGIKGSQLKKFNVYALSRATYSRGNYHRVLYIHKNRELAFCYYIDKEWKLYFPERTKNRFYQVSQIAIQGYEHLPLFGDYVVITKSYKDVIGFDVYHIPSVAPQSENILLDKLLIKDLRSRFDNLYILYDNDHAGKRAMVKRMQEYPELLPLCFAADQKKDLTDNMKKFGVEYVGKILKKHIK